MTAPVRKTLPVCQLPDGSCQDPVRALNCEWLVTNGIGGFAAGTVAGALTRRYHGLLIAALQPPLGRTLLVAKLDETARVGGESFELATNVWRDGLAEPPGCRLLSRFELGRGVPTWEYAFAGCRLTKRIWMEAGHNVTYVRYVLQDAPQPVALSFRLLLNRRDYHALRHRDDWPARVTQSGGTGLRVEVVEGNTLIHISTIADTARQPTWTAEQTWYRDFSLMVEQARGFDHLEDHLCAGDCRVDLAAGHSITFVFAGGADATAARACLDPTAALRRGADRTRRRLRRWRDVSGTSAAKAPAALEQLVLAADQFIVARPTPEQPKGHTIIAGYPWFTDWGRDTMIALPGLTLTTGRFDVARQILRTWARYVDRGMIPNRFPDEGQTPDYNAADAALWYLWAIDQYVRATGDRRTLAELFPAMRQIVDGYRQGTRYNIHVDTDGLVYAGVEGVNLTWMDAKIGTRVITPRTGKAVELSALWYDGLCNLARLAEILGQPAGEYKKLAQQTRASFRRFWNAARNCCHDVLDGPHGTEARLRPNQIFAVALEHSPLEPDQQRAVVAACTDKLLTPMGLRSLAPDEPDYRGQCVGGPVARDEAYHQGTVWGWLLGPFVIAHYRVYGDACAATRLLEPVFENLTTHCVGTLSEVFDGDPPHAPRGCFAQAWTVAETLRAWHTLRAARD
ncbi:MAG: amylo-alpha-1,6-glucosidase [Planctomycetes bacterium]|nr:amylo-alpha-1,6-glucosidase [Planctomycetota bacterium]